MIVAKFCNQVRVKAKRPNIIAYCSLHLSMDLCGVFNLFAAHFVSAITNLIFPFFLIFILIQSQNQLNMTQTSCTTIQETFERAK